jgi:hypothetical protein
MRTALLLLIPTIAFARASNETPYSVGEVFSTAIRFVRIDKSCKITDQDANAAFVTFEYEEEGRVRRGSLEIWKTANGSNLQITLGDEPHYVELRWVELIGRKLRDERGTPVPVRPSPVPSNP